KNELSSVMGCGCLSSFIPVDNWTLSAVKFLDKFGQNSVRDGQPVSADPDATIADAFNQAFRDKVVQLFAAERIAPPTLREFSEVHAGAETKLQDQRLACTARRIEALAVIAGCSAFLDAGHVAVHFVAVHVA